MTGWRWPFRLGDVLEVWRDHELVGELSIELLTSLIVHYLVGHELARRFDGALHDAAILPAIRRPLVTLPRRAAITTARVIHDADYRAQLRAQRRAQRRSRRRPKDN